LTEALYHTR